MITDTFQLRPHYGEVDQMRYVYHANYLTYCHQARNELLRKLNLDEVVLERNNIILPVISFDISYKKPAYFDELITVKTIIREMPKVRFNFEFEIRNEQNILLIKAKSTVVFVDVESRLPKKIPEFIQNIFKKEF
ncbi:acyl-CoA thioesterase [Winogradskyella undariae]|uniref:acyl-CoA thioesterase n=1 Tax=Winogradskyella undariae TaxID=1285465 RepID=UPI00156A8180|nr:acyl-CoA thioesterase [Winogradskyella undariae]